MMSFVHYYGHHDNFSYSIIFGKNNKSNQVNAKCFVPPPHSVDFQFFIHGTSFFLMQYRIDAQVWVLVKNVDISRFFHTSCSSCTFVNIKSIIVNLANSRSRIFSINKRMCSEGENPCDNEGNNSYTKKSIMGNCSLEIATHP